MRFKKVARTLFYLLGILFFLILSVEGFLNFYVNRKLNRLIENEVNNRPDRKYHLSVGNAGLSLLKRSFRAENVLLEPDSINDHNGFAFAFSIHELTLNGIGILNVLLNREIRISSIRMENPVIKIYTPAVIPTDTAEAPGGGLFELIREKYKSVFVEEINIANAKLSMFKNKKEVLLSEKNNIYVRKFFVDASTARQGKLFFAEDVQARMQNFNYHLNDFYSISGKNLYASYKDSLMSVDSLRLVPRFSRKRFGAVTKSQSRVLLQSGRLELEGADVEGFLVRNEFRCRSGLLNSLFVSVYLDKNITFIPSEKPSLQRILRNIPVPLSVRSLAIRNSNVIYEHLAPGGRMPGRISFNALTADVSGLTNQDTLKTTQQNLTIKSKCRFMNVSDLKVDYYFPLKTDKEVFECRGSLKPMDLKALNPILENVAFLSVKNGRLDEFTFSFNANEKQSEGTSKFYYHDLDLELENKKHSFNTGRKIMFTVAKALIINKRNPNNFGKPGITRLHYERYPNKYFFYYTWKTLQSGIMDALGARSGKFLTRSDDK